MEMIHDVKRILLAFGRLICDHPLQIYNSALLFVPRTTALFKQYASQDQMTCTLLNAQSNWSPLLLTLNGHTDNVWSITFSPDGTRLASCSSDKTVGLWDAHTGSPIRGLIVGHTDAVLSITFSPNGTRLASCSFDKTVRL
jgi:WD40 repeat protein